MDPSDPEQVVAALERMIDYVRRGDEVVRFATVKDRTGERTTFEMQIKVAPPKMAKVIRFPVERRA